MKGVALAACAVAVGVLARPGPSQAQLSGSPHDFSGEQMEKGGACSACHRPHSFIPRQLLLWSRDLTQEWGFFAQDGTPTPNYVPQTAVLCYDCHDDGSIPDGDPISDNWDIGHEPQNIAFTDLVPANPEGTPTATGYYEVLDGRAPGPGNLPPDGGRTGGHYWKSLTLSGTPAVDQGDKIACNLCHDPHNSTDRVGGNQVMFLSSTTDGNGLTIPLVSGAKASLNTRVGQLVNQTTGTGREMCTSCHSWSQDSGTPVNTPVNLWGEDLPKPPGTIPQHRYSGSSSSESNPSQTVACTTCHLHNKISISCSDCHGFPPTVVADFDPVSQPAGQSYAGGAGVHLRHKEALTAIGSSIYACDICHGPNPGPGASWHPNATAAWSSGLVQQGNVNIIGKKEYWSPTDYPSPPGNNPTYDGGGSGPGISSYPDYVLSSLGGGNQRCSGVACHGYPVASENLVWSDLSPLGASPKMVDDNVGDTGGQAVNIWICKGCHDSTPAKIGAATGKGPNVLGDGAAAAWATGGWGADINGHGNGTGNFYDKDVVGGGGGLEAKGLECSVCHDARYSAGVPVRTHFGTGTDPRDETRLRATINGEAITTGTVSPPGSAPDQACLACHQVGGGTYSASEDGRVVSHGNSGADGYRKWEADSFRRRCRACHEPHGASWNNTTVDGRPPRNLHMVGKWIDDGDGVAEPGEEARVDSNASGFDPDVDISSADVNKVIFKTAGGPGLMDYSWDDGNPSGVAANADSICTVCHVSLENGHSTSTNQESQGTGHLTVGSQCRLCHQHGKLSTRPNGADDAFGPLSCFACHGVAPADVPPSGELAGQYWPSGAPSNVPAFNYANDDKGAHRRHIEAIGLKLFNQSAAQLVVGDSTYTTYEKQLAVCEFCHYDPGGADATPDPWPHFDNTATDNSPGDPAPRVDVLQSTDLAAAPGLGPQYFQKYTSGSGLYGHTNATSDTAGGAYDFTTRSCANLACHNQNATPDGSPGNPGNWNAPPVWAPAPPTCSTLPCHDPAATYNTGAHLKHIGGAAGQKAYACTECHAANTSLQHGDGVVDLAWDNTGSLEQAHGSANAFYDKDDSGDSTPAPGDTGFAYKTGGYNHACGSVYCHGGDNAGWGGGDTTPQWDNLEALPGGVYCGACHAGNGTGGATHTNGTALIASGNHTAHLTAAYGPGLANPPAVAADSCLGTATSGCHPGFQTDTATHVNGTKELTTIALADSTLDLTDRCDNCHSTAAVNLTTGVDLAKANWSNGSYTLPCVTCHNGTDPATDNLAGNDTDPADPVAPDVLGDDANYGAEARGHNRQAADGNYPVSDNPAASLACTDCHDAAAPHLNDTADTTFAGNRMRGTINSVSVADATAACNACHATTATAPPSAQLAKNRRVNTHSNGSYSGRLEEPFVTDLLCMQCHEPHGMTENGGPGYNIQMINPKITVVVGQPPVTGVRFEALTGANSFNDGLGSETEDICVVCHVNPGNPNQPMNHNAGGNHAFGLDYSNDERGSDCGGCHAHNRDNNTTTVDGFMPMDCNICHTFPAKDNVGGTHPLSAAHARHAGVPNPGGVPNYGFSCSGCHYQSSHNNRGLNQGDTWSGVTDAMVQVRFDNRPWPDGWNPATTHLNGSRDLDSDDFDEGTKVCTNLYCHGADAARFPAADQGADTTPAWDSAASAACGTCHRAGAGAAPNPTDPPGTLAHPVHNGTAAGQYGIGCAVCHYGTTDDGTSIANMGMHVNRSVEVSFNQAADSRVHTNSTYNGDTTIGSGYGSCAGTYCHSNGTDLTAPYDSAGGTADPGTDLVWSATDNCADCHGNGTIPFPTYDDDGSIKANKHPIHSGVGNPGSTRNTNGYACPVCHWPTTHANGSVYEAANHVNGSYNVGHDATAPALRQFDYAAGTPGTCNNANCHGGNDGISWGRTGLPYACNVCHMTAGAVETADDVNNFNGDDAVQSKIGATDYNRSGGGHGADRFPTPLCDNCHSSDWGHDNSTALSDTNPFRLLDNNGGGPGDFGCSDTGSGCHAGAAASAVLNHSPTDMSDSEWNPQVGTWGFTPKCVDCHDPHGDPLNLRMIQKELVEGSGANWVPTVWPPENTDLVFTDDTTGAHANGSSFADLDDPFSSLCQECHETGDPDFTSFEDGVSAAGISHPAMGANPGDCSQCHQHSRAFAPNLCEDCHGTPPYDPDGTGPQAAAPDVIQVTGLGGENVWDGTWWDSTAGLGDSGNTQQGGHGDPDGLPDVACTGCHDISQPPGNYHLNGIAESTGPSVAGDSRTSSGVNANTAHMRAEFIGSGSPDYNIQVTFDNACSGGNPLSCHYASGVDREDLGAVPPEYPMRHCTDANSVPPSGVYQVTMGEHGTKDGDTPPLSRHLPLDEDLSSNKTGSTLYAPCVSCHDPHGTRVDDSTGPRNTSSNIMMRYEWTTKSTLCRICH